MNAMPQLVLPQPMWAVLLCFRVIAAGVVPDQTVPGAVGCSKTRDGEDSELLNEGKGLQFFHRMLQSLLVAPLA